MTLQRILLVAFATVLLAGIVPAGLVVDRSLARELTARSTKELAMAPAVLADRNSAVSDALMMRAKDLAGSPDLAAALAAGDTSAAREALGVVSDSATGGFALVDAAGRAWLGPAVDPAMVEATRRGEMPVGVALDPARPSLVGLAPVLRDSVWIGAAGVSLALDESFAGTLAGLTRSDVVLLFDGEIAAASTTTEGAREAALGRPAAEGSEPGVRTVEVDDRSFLVTAGAIGKGASAVFLRDLEGELAVLPELRRAAAVAAGAALLFTLLLAALLAARIARPVRRLAGAADRLAEGDFETPLEDSWIRELDRMARAFEAMRKALAARMSELVQANRELEERQERLGALQGELIRRERTSATGWLVTQLAHEIRNPIASLRNNLEVIHRRLEGDPEAREFADLAIEELLRMHELAERVLDLNRPTETDVAGCDPARVARDVAALVEAGDRDGELRVEVEGEGRAAIPPDACKQILLNLIQNAREAAPEGVRVRVEVRREGGVVVVEVADDGPGIPEDLLPRIFDPFFTTRGVAGGSGLGLYIARGIASRHGGALRAENRPRGAGALFRIELPRGEPASPASTSSASASPQSTSPRSR